MTEWLSRFSMGETVQLANLPNGNPPVYRFKGEVCGSYRNPVSGEPGAVISSYAEPGCIQLFSDRRLERVTSSNGKDG